MRRVARADPKGCEIFLLCEQRKEKLIVLERDFLTINIWKKRVESLTSLSYVSRWKRLDRRSDISPLHEKGYLPGTPFSCI